MWWRIADSLLAGTYTRSAVILSAAVLVSSCGGHSSGANSRVQQISNAGDSPAEVSPPAEPPAPLFVYVESSPYGDVLIDCVRSEGREQFAEDFCGTDTLPLSLLNIRLS
jgi:hypothetical protein